MKITIDIDELLQEGKISQAEYDKLNQFAARGTSSLAFNILVGFGVIAVSGAALALLPTATTAAAIGLVVCAAGITIIHGRHEHWTVLANICVVAGALLFGAGVIKSAEGSVASCLLVAVAFAGAGVFARSSLLTVLAVLALSSCLGARTGYLHATYFLGIEDPAATIALFAVLSVAAYQASKRVGAQYQGIAIAAARTGVFLINFGFWIGSLWGEHQSGGEIQLFPDWAFAACWAVALLLAGIWAWRRNRRWMVNVVAVFGGIHFYTQWFERLGATPATVLFAGLLAIGLAIGLRALNTAIPSEA